MKDARLVQSRDPVLSQAVADAVRHKALELATGLPDVALLRKATSDIYLGFDVFYEMFTSHVVQTDTQRLEWVSALRHAIRDTTTDFSGLVFARGREDVLAEVAAWNAVRDPFAVWEFTHHIAYRDPPLIEFGILLRLDRAEWLKAFDALPAPSLMWTTAWLSLVEDPDIIEELLTLAPPLLDESGVWTRSAAVPILVQLMETHAERVHGALRGAVFGTVDGSPERAAAERISKDFEQRELPARLHQFYRSLLGRADGRFVAHRVLAELAPAAVRKPQTPYRSWSAKRAAFGSLAATMAVSGVSAEQAQEAWRRREADARREHEAQAARPVLRGATERRVDERLGEGRRSLHAQGFPWLLGALAILEQGTAAPADVEWIWSWFQELLVGRDPGLRLTEGGETREEAVRRVGALLAQLPDPAARWHTAWRLLEPQRRRGQFGVRYGGDSHFDRESVFLVQVGLQACAARVELLPANESRAPMHDLFWSLYAAARRLWLTSAMDIGERRRELVAVCFAFVPEIFGDGCGDALVRAFQPIANDPWLLARACSYLRLNGVAPDRLKLFVARAGVDLDAALLEAHEWAALIGQKGESPSTFKQLAEELQAANQSLNKP